MTDRYVNVEGRVDTWYAVFSPHVANVELNRWLEASTDEGCRHVYLFRRAGPMGVMQIEATGFGAFCEYVGAGVPEILLMCKERGERVFEWGIQWDQATMKGRLESEVLAMNRQGIYEVELEKLRAPVYIRPGYFSCVALVKVFLKIADDKVLKPRELMEYIQAHGALEV